MWNLDCFIEKSFTMARNDGHIINILIRCKFASMLNLASSASTKLYYAILKIANCVSKVGH